MYYKGIAIDLKIILKLNYFFVLNNINCNLNDMKNLNARQVNGLISADVLSAARQRYKNNRFQAFSFNFFYKLQQK